MKKNLLYTAALAAATLFGMPEAYAQGPYLKLGIGYNFPAASEIQYNMKSNSGITTFKSENINLGKGVPLNLGAGYMFSEHIGAELGLGFLFGTGSTITNEYPDFSGGPGSVIIEEKTEVYSRMFLIQPSVIISAGGDKIRPYARFGLIAAKGTVHMIQKAEAGSDEAEIKRELNGGWGLGLQAGLGAEFGLNDRISLFGELTMNNLSYAPEKGKITKMEYNGEDFLDFLPTSEVKVVFVDRLEESEDGSDFDEDKPSKELKQNLPFSSVGIGIGIKMKF